MNITKNIQIKGKHNKPILVDVFFEKNNLPKPIVIFCHGYKGFKDWGPWNAMAKKLAGSGCCFVKFNFAYNGGTVEQPIDFQDLEAFGNNNYSKELDDLDSVIDWLIDWSEKNTNFNSSDLTLLGHSRGGGIVTLKAQQDSRISKVISLAGVSDFGSRFPTGDIFEKWKQDGVYYVVNGRTKQDMPHFYQFYEDFKLNEKRLSIKKAASNLLIPHLIIHGDKDTSVLIEEAYNLHKWNPKSILQIIKNADHVFNTKHPWGRNDLSKELNQCAELVKTFILADQ